MGKLTTLAVKAATSPGRYIDGEGLSLVVKPARDVGAAPTRSWVLRIQVAGRRRDFGCGSAERVSLKDAREKAATIRKEFEAGLDPVAEKKKRQAPPALTFKAAAERLHAELKPSWSKGKHGDDWLSSLERHAFAKLGKLPVDTIDGPVIRDTLLPIWLKIPETARRVRQRIGAVLDWAHSNGLRPTEAPLRSVTKGLPRQSKPRTHFAAMPYSQVPAFIADMNAATATIGRLALEFTILTAARSGEVRGATWAEFDLKAAKWTIPAARMKMKRSHAVPLSARALEIVQQLHDQRGTSKYVFPGNSGQALSDMTLTKVLRDAGLMTQEDEPRPITAHGFRSSFRDWAGEQTSFPGDVCEAALAHDVKNPTERAYHRTRYYDRRVALMEAWGQFVGGKSNVVQLVAA